MKTPEASRKLQEFLENTEKSQKEIANATNISQPRISRFRTDGFKTLKGHAETLCRYAGIDVKLHTEDENEPAGYSNIKEAVFEVWDRSEKKAKALAKVIKSLKGLS
jgi:transcriptional regulator with XRE-family HTH domain